MSLRSRLIVLVGAALLAGVLASAWMGGDVQAATAHGETTRSLQALLDDARNAETRITIQFNRPLISGEATWTLPDATLRRAIGEVGMDFVCFEEPWNAGVRSRCTPFSNIISLEFTRPAGS